MSALRIDFGVTDKFRRDGLVSALRMDLALRIDFGATGQGGYGLWEWQQQAVVFSNPGMSLKGVSEAGSFGRLLFGILSYMLRRCRRGGGNVG
ncbi:MAG: hypothetical protein WCF54_09420, partial [Terracidiphilus sp.]